MDKISVGYKAICDQLDLATLPHYRESYIAKHGRGKTIIDNHREIHIYPKTYALKDEHDLLANLEFALKHDGINLEIISAFFKKIEKNKITQYIESQPTGIYSRKIWYLYEFLMDEQLNLKDLLRIKYVNLLDPKKYFTSQPIKSSRHAINDNLLGNSNFCPVVRRTETLEKFIIKRLDDQTKNILKKYNTALISRASSYLYTKETMSSYQIEREQPDKSRVARFIQMLQQAPKLESLTKAVLIQLQNIIVDPRFKDVDYRQTQNYVGENITPYFQRVHFISPKPEDLPQLMQGLLDALDRMLAAKVHPVIIAAVISFGFVFIHPFEDGNGRIHRFLIHAVLSKTDFTSKEIIFPISAIMLQNIGHYDAILETFSKPLLTVLTNYHLSDEGVMTVNQESKYFYQYIDFTLIVEYLFTCIEDAINNHIEREIEFLMNYDKTKSAIQKVVDMPDKLIDLLIKLTLQNKGNLSEQKKKKYFNLLSENEITQAVDVIRHTMMNNPKL